MTASFFFRHGTLSLAVAALVSAAGPGQAQPLRLSNSLPSAAARGNAPQQADYIVAVVNSEPITNNEVRARLVRAEQQLTQQGAALLPRSEMAKQVLERLIAERALLQMAKEIGVKVDDAAVEQAEMTVAQQNQMGLPEFRRRLQSEGLSTTAFRDDLRNQLLLSRLRDREVEPRVKVSDLEVEQFIREQQDTPASSAPVDLNLGHILVAVPENASEAQVVEFKAKAERAQQRVRAGEDFAAVARESSDAPNAAAGGAIGLRGADRYPALFVEGTAQLRMGGVSEVLRSAAGFHVLKVLDKRQAGLLALSVTQSKVRHILLRPSPQFPEAQALRQAADFKRRLEGGQADFAQLAREHSQDGSARSGGDLGWTNPGTFVPEFEEAVNNLQPGQFSEPVASRFGVHLIQLQERREQQLGPREQREIARGLVREKKLEETYQQWVQDVRGRAYVELREPPQ